MSVKAPPTSFSAAVIPTESDAVRLKLYGFGEHLSVGEVSKGRLKVVSTSLAWPQLKQLLYQSTIKPGTGSLPPLVDPDQLQVFLLPDGEEVTSSGLLAHNDKVVVYRKIGDKPFTGSLFDVEQVSELTGIPAAKLITPLERMPSWKATENPQRPRVTIPPCASTSPSRRVDSTRSATTCTSVRSVGSRGRSERQKIIASMPRGVKRASSLATLPGGVPKIKSDSPTDSGFVPSVVLAGIAESKEAMRRQEIRERFQAAVRRVIFINRFGGNAQQCARKPQAQKSMDAYIKEQTNIYQYNEFRNAKHERLPLTVFHPEATTRVGWDVMILGLVVFFGFMVPYRIGFDISLTHAEDVFEVIADIIFLIDIGLNFRTAYKEDGVLVVDGNLIARAYLTSWFPIDLLASFPVGWFTGGAAGGVNRLFRILRLFKLFRMLRLLKLFPKLFQLLETSIRFNPSMIRFLRSIVIMIMMWHWIACAYWYVAREEYGGMRACEDITTGEIRTCFVNLCLCGSNDVADRIIFESTDVSWFDEARPDGWVPEPAYADRSQSFQYAQALFWSVEVTTGIGGDINPVSETEVYFTTGVTIVGLMMYSLIIGSASSALANMDSTATHRRQTLDSVSSFMRSRKVPSFFQRIIVDFYEHMWSTPSTATDVFKDLPASLQTRLSMVMNRHLVERVPSFQLLPAETFIRLVQRLQHNTFLPGEFVVREGEEAKCLFIIKRGKCDAVRSEDLPIIETFKPGDFFGENALLYDTRYSTSFRAVDFLDVVTISKEDFFELQISAPDFFETVRKTDMLRHKRRLETLVSQFQEQQKMDLASYKFKPQVVRVIDEDFSPVTSSSDSSSSEKGPVIARASHASLAKLRSRHVMAIPREAGKFASLVAKSKHAVKSFLGRSKLKDKVQPTPHGHGGSATFQRYRAEKWKGSSSRSRRSMAPVATRSQHKELLNEIRKEPSVLKLGTFVAAGLSESAASLDHHSVAGSEQGDASRSRRRRSNRRRPRSSSRSLDDSGRRPSKGRGLASSDSRRYAAVWESSASDNSSSDAAGNASGVDVDPPAERSGARSSRPSNGEHSATTTLENNLPEVEVSRRASSSEAAVPVEPVTSQSGPGDPSLSASTISSMVPAPLPLRSNVAHGMPSDGIRSVTSPVVAAARPDATKAGDDLVHLPRCVSHSSSRSSNLSLASVTQRRSSAGAVPTSRQVRIAVTTSFAPATTLDGVPLGVAGSLHRPSAVSIASMAGTHDSSKAKLPELVLPRVTSDTRTADLFQRLSPLGGTGEETQGLPSPSLTPLDASGSFADADLGELLASDGKFDAPSSPTENPAPGPTMSLFKSKSRRTRRQSTVRWAADAGPDDGAADRVGSEEPASSIPHPGVARSAASASVALGVAVAAADAASAADTAGSATAYSAGLEATSSAAALASSISTSNDDIIPLDSSLADVVGDEPTRASVRRGSASGHSVSAQSQDGSRDDMHPFALPGDAGNILEHVDE